MGGAAAPRLHPVLLSAARLASTSTVPLSAFLQRRGASPARLHIGEARRPGIRAAQPTHLATDPSRRRRWGGNGRLPRPLPAAARDQPPRPARRISALWA